MILIPAFFHVIVMMGYLFWINWGNRMANDWSKTDGQFLGRTRRMVGAIQYLYGRMVNVFIEYKLFFKISTLRNI